MDVGEGREQDAEASLIAPYNSYWFWLCQVGDEAEIKVPRCAEFLFVIFVGVSGA
jgi:hypothetical protein